MAEAPLKWKVDFLRQILAAPSTARWVPDPNTSEMDWFRDMMRDGFIEASEGRFIDPAKIQPNMLLFSQDGPYGFYDFHVPTKGKELVEDYDSQRTIRGIWKRYHLLIFGWILGIVSALVILYLSHAYFH